MAVIFPLMVSACSQTTDLAGSVKSMVVPTKSHGYSAREKECLMRAMFFESNRSSRDGLVAVGTVVMNRVRSEKWGDSICGVVGAPRQFAPGVMTRKMNSKALPDVDAAAEAVLKGERHPKVKNSMFFHTAGLKFPYKNMHYTVVAGGNAFYEKRNRNGDPVVLPPEKAPLQPQIMIAKADVKPAVPAVQAPAVAAPTQVAAADIQGTTDPALGAAAAVPAIATAAPVATTATTATAAAFAKPTMVAMARPVMSGRADGGQAAPARARPVTNAAPQIETQPTAVAMAAIDGPSPSSQARATAPFPDAPAAPVEQLAAVSGEVALPATTDVMPTPTPQVIAVADTARADGWTTGAPAAPAPQPEAVASYAVDQDDADAIGAMLMDQERPAFGFN